MNWFRQRKVRKNAANRLYDIAVEHSRDPAFYGPLGVADSIDGRFDLLTLYVFLMMNRLNALGPEGGKLAQALFDRMFRMIDLTLREMGIGDMGIPKHMKKMMKAFNGRAHIYRQALQARSMDDLAQALSRNVYRVEGEVFSEHTAMLAQYAFAVHDAFEAMTLDDLMREAVHIPAINDTTTREAAIA